MSWFVRTLLTWMLVLAVPLQGAAAATMAFCGPSHHGAGQVGHSDPAVGVGPVDQHQGDGEADDHPHAHAVYDEGASASAQAAPQAKFVHADKHKCSACASCCAAAALPSSIATFEPPLLDDLFLPLVPRSVLLLLIDCLERPPRIVLA